MYIWRRDSWRENISSGATTRFLLIPGEFFEVFGVFGVCGADGVTGTSTTETYNLLKIILI